MKENNSNEIIAKFRKMQTQIEMINVINSEMNARDIPNSCYIGESVATVFEPEQFPYHLIEVAAKQKTHTRKQ